MIGSGLCVTGLGVDESGYGVTGSGVGYSVPFSSLDGGGGSSMSGAGGIKRSEGRLSHFGFTKAGEQPAGSDANK